MIAVHFRVPLSLSKAHPATPQNLWGKSDRPVKIGFRAVDDAQHLILKRIQLVKEEVLFHCGLEQFRMIVGEPLNQEIKSAADTGGPHIFPPFRPTFYDSAVSQLADDLPVWGILDEPDSRPAAIEPPHGQAPGEHLAELILINVVIPNIGETCCHTDTICGPNSFMQSAQLAAKFGLSGPRMQDAIDEGCEALRSGESR